MHASDRSSQKLEDRCRKRAKDNSMMSTNPRLLFIARVTVPLLLWVTHLFLPVLERTEPKPGWVQIYFIFWPMGWLLLVSHGLFLSAVGLSAFRRWAEALFASLGAAALLLLCRPGPIYYLGIQTLWAAYISIILSASLGLVFRRRPVLGLHSSPTPPGK